MRQFNYRRRMAKGSAIVWFLIFIVLAGAIGYYFVQRNQEERRILQEKYEQQQLEKEKKAAEKKAKEEESRKKAKEKKAKELAEKKAKEEQRREEARQEKAQREAEEARLREEREQAEAEEQRRRDEIEHQAREAAEREQEEQQEEPTEEEPEPEVVSRFGKPVKNPLPDLTPFAIPCKDKIQPSTDKVIGTWNWDETEKLEGLDKFPTDKEGWKRSSDGALMTTALQACRSWRNEKLAYLKACPAAKDFPGLPEDGASIVKRTLEIDADITGWHSTGLYAPPGAEISVNISGAPKECPIDIRIGCHTDSLQKLDEWRRFPEITMQIPVEKNRLKMKNPMGGLVYVCVGRRPKRGKTFRVSISGATPAPLYVHGETTDDQWAEQLEKSKAPWGEIRMPRLVVTMPIEQLKSATRLKETTEFLQKNQALQDWLMGWDAWEDKLHNPMRFVVDRQISAGAGHSGYPAMGTLDWTSQIANGSISDGRGNWGLWHELGHNHQAPPFVMEGQTEVSVNLFSMLCEVVGSGLDYEQCWGGGMGPEGMTDQVRTYMLSSDRYNDAENRVQLFFWVELMYHTGFENFRKVAQMYRDKPYDNGKLSDQEKWEWVMHAFSKVTGKNMGPFFKIWKMPVSEKAIEKNKNLKTWLPTEDYPACYTKEVSVR